MPVSVTTCATLDEAARALAASRSARFLGGGTLIMRRVNEGAQGFDTIVRATDPAAKRIDASGSRITLGAAVTMVEIIAHRDLAFLAPVARAVGGPAIRSMATVGGNLFAPHPYGDFTAALLVLEATVAIAGGSSQPLADLLANRRRDPRPLVTAITFERPRDLSAFRFRKVTRVKPKGVSIMSIAALLPQSGGIVSGARVAYGAMAPTPVRVAAVERALEGKRLDQVGVSTAIAAATEGLAPPTDPIASEWYRREIAPVHLRRLLLNEP